MLREEDIAIELKCQQYICKSYMRNLEGTESVLLFESTQKTEDVFCPFCHGSVHICELTSKFLKDIPIWKGVHLALWVVRQQRIDQPLVKAQLSTIRRVG